MLLDNMNVRTPVEEKNAKIKISCPSKCETKRSVHTSFFQFFSCLSYGVQKKEQKICIKLGRYLSLNIVFIHNLVLQKNLKIQENGNFFSLSKQKIKIMSIYIKSEQHPQLFICFLLLNRNESGRR